MHEKQKSERTGRLQLKKSVAPSGERGRIDPIDTLEAAGSKTKAAYEFLGRSSRSAVEVLLNIALSCRAV